MGGGGGGLGNGWSRCFGVGPRDGLVPKGRHWS